MKQIKYLRLKYQLTQDELANILHISQQTVYKYETGKSEPPVSVLDDICRIFQLSMDQLIGLTDPHIPYTCMYPKVPSEKTILKNYRLMDEDAKKSFAELSYRLAKRTI